MRWMLSGYKMPVALTENNSDVIVIGSGPAGIAAAITCVNAGLKTILLSKSAPVEKQIPLTPSESVHPGIASLLEMLHASDALTTASRSTYDGITINGEHAALGADESGTWEGHHIDRILFDSHLLEAARKQGVTIHKNEIVNDILLENDRVTGICTSSGKTIRGNYVIDCSGHQRIAGKKLKFKERFYSPPFVVWTGVAENIDASFFETAKTQFIPAPNGWTWLAPEAPSRCTWTRLALKGEKDLCQPAELDKYGSTAELLVSNRRWRAFRPLVKEGIVLCGDAAGILDPAAGQGILNALWSGIKAGQCVGQCVSNAAMESFYLAQYDSWFIGQYEEKVEKLKEYYIRLGIQAFDN